MQALSLFGATHQFVHVVCVQRIFRVILASRGRAQLFILWRAQDQFGWTAAAHGAARGAAASFPPVGDTHSPLSGRHTLPPALQPLQ